MLRLSLKSRSEKVWQEQPKEIATLELAAEPKKTQSEYPLWHKLGLFLGPLTFLLLQLIPETASFTGSMRGVAGSTLWIAIWWLTEAVPIPVTSLLPLVIFPLSGGLQIGRAHV